MRLKTEDEICEEYADSIGVGCDDVIQLIKRARADARKPLLEEIFTAEAAHLKTGLRGMCQ